MQYTDDEIKGNLKDFNGALEAIRNELQRLRGEFDGFRAKDHHDLSCRVTALENKIKILAGRKPEVAMPTSAGVDNDEFKGLAGRVGALEQNVNDLRNEFARWIKDFQDALNSKAESADLEELRNMLIEKITEIVKGLTKTLADKNETKKALKLLERQLKNLYDLFMSRGGNDNEDDAMFSKKPLGGFSCASCEKDLINLYGKKVEFLPWSKLPFRDPAERIARVGQGFSKMLSMINPDQLSRYDNHTMGGSKMPHETGNPMSSMDHFGGGGGQGSQIVNEGDMQDGGDGAQKTHTRFPNPNQRFATSEGKRPGSAQIRKIARANQKYAKK